MFLQCDYLIDQYDLAHFLVILLKGLPTIQYCLQFGVMGSRGQSQEVLE